MKTIYRIPTTEIEIVAHSKGESKMARMFIDELEMYAEIHKDAEERAKVVRFFSQRLEGVMSYFYYAGMITLENSLTCFEIADTIEAIHERYYK